MAGRLTLKTNWRQQLGSYWISLATQFGYLNTMLTELFTDVVITVPVSLHASKVTYNLFVARRGYTVTSIDYTPDIAQGGALTATVVKATSTTIPASATTPMHIAAAINLNGTAHTVQPITVTTTAADLVLAAGNRIGLVLSGAMTVGSGTVTIRMSRT
tara:strand:- start:853 stop:1329 length:477 start_codon:yes stop_codon:yes gene_type:complete